MAVSPTTLLRIIRTPASAAMVIGIALLYHYAATSVNNTTVALTLLLAILGIAAAWGLVEATLASVIAVLCLNYFFLPPVGTLTIADPQNWMALFAFLITAVTASQLSVRAKKRAAEAVARRLEVEKLHALGQAMLLISTWRTAPRDIVNLFLKTYDVPAATFFHKSESSIFRSGPQTLVISDQQLQEAAGMDEPLIHADQQIALVPIRLGGQPIGSLGIVGRNLSKGALNAVGYLVAIGTERAHAFEEAGRIEAARQSERLKSALLDALAHELKTPLTSITGALTHLIGKEHDAEERELLTLATEEANRLGNLVTEIIEMARIEAGKFQVQRHPHPIGEIISAALRDFGKPLEGRQVELQIDPALPEVEVDFDLVQQVIKQLVDNAIKYSPSGSPLDIRAEAKSGGVIVSVTDHGSGIDDQEQLHIFDKFFRGGQWQYEVPGTGLGLAIARGMVEAHGGRIWVASQPGKGSTFSFSLPALPRERVQ
jgi:two-component system, OmpR family, sensor histidine kinase KdpD